MNRWERYCVFFVLLLKVCIFCGFASAEGIKGNKEESFTVWGESSMRRVLMDAQPKRGSESGQVKASISLAKGEYESFQVALRAGPGGELKGCTVELSDLRSERGGLIPKSDIEWHQVGWVKIEKVSHPMTAGAKAGWWPDPLLKVSKFDVPDGVTVALWFTVHAPEGIAAGEYKGEFVIRCANGEQQQVKVNAGVYDFELGVEPHIKTAFSVVERHLEKIYGEVSQGLRRSYWDYALKHRVNPDDFWKQEPVDVNEIEYYMGRGLNSFCIINIDARQRKRRTSPDSYTAEFKASLLRKLDPCIAKLRDRGLLDKGYVYGFDEQEGQYWPVIKEYFGLIRERYGVPTMKAVCEEKGIGLNPEAMEEFGLKWHLPVSCHYDFEAAEKCRRAGYEVWSYICNGPLYPFANWMADFPLIEARVLWWQVYHQKMDGFLYWGINIWTRENNDHIIEPEKDGPRLAWRITTTHDRRFHGDGTLVYPGREGPIGSIRLANIRDGIEDYEYLCKLASIKGSVERAREACLAVIAEGAADTDDVEVTYAQKKLPYLTTFSRNPEVLYKQRDIIAGRIIKGQRQ